MKFRFEALLKLRKNKENLAQKNLAAINTIMLKQQENLHIMESIENQSRQDLNLRMKMGTTIPMMLLYDNFFYGVRSQEKRQDKIISQIGQQQETRRAELAEAMARRRVMEVLKERDFQALNAARNKRETEQMDEIGASQWRQKNL